MAVIGRWIGYIWRGYKPNNRADENAVSPGHLKALAGSYEALFSRRAMKFRSMGLNEVKLTENDYRRLILEEYTFLKRPVLVLGDQIFVGSTKKTVAAAAEALAS